MKNCQQMSIALPTELVEYIKDKVRSGEYASESEVIQDGVSALLESDRAMEDWLKRSVAPAFDALKADPSRHLSIEDIRAILQRLHDRSDDL